MFAIQGQYTTDRDIHNTLSDRHRDELQTESGISPAVVAQRGVFTATKPSELLALGFSPEQARLTPGRMDPLHTAIDGDRLYIFKPDRPRLDERGRPRKYEFPAGKPNRLDIPPGCRHEVLHGAGDVILTEGTKKADAAVTHGLTCVAITGVYNWLTKTFGDRTAPIPDLAVLKGRTVHLAPDSDAATNHGVAEAFRRLGLHLEGAYNCDVRLITLPRGANGEKCGLDDYLLTHDADDLWQLSRKPTDGAVDYERQQKEKYKAERDELRDRERALFDLLGNARHEGNARIMQAFVLRDYAERRTEGREQIVIERLAAKAGLSAHAAGRWIARGDAAGVWKRTEGARAFVDGHEYRPVFVEPTEPGSLADLYRAASLTADSKTVKRGTFHARRCDVCRSDDVRVTARYECLGCGHTWQDAPRDVNPTPQPQAERFVQQDTILSTAERFVHLVEPTVEPTVQAAIPPPLDGMIEIDLDAETDAPRDLQTVHARPTERFVPLVEPTPPPKCHSPLGCLQTVYCGKQGRCPFDPTPTDVLPFQPFRKEHNSEGKRH
jgi:hypothetical protein